MSKASDKFERDVADFINSIPGLKAERPKAGTEYSDIKVTRGNIISWIEVKMNHRDNLSNPRFFYEHNQWKTSYKTPVALELVELLNKSNQSATFIKNISEFSNIPKDKIFISTTKSGLKKENVVSLEAMKAYFSQPNVNRYILFEEDFDIGNIVTRHYLEGKKEPVYYLQAGNDFYMFGTENPLGFDSRVPVFSGRGDIKVRVATRSKFYEIQAEVKLNKIDVESQFSFKPVKKIPL